MAVPGDRERLLHILDAIDKIEVALRAYDQARFQQDWEKQLVIERLIEIIGEAANRLSQELQTSQPQIPWPQIVGMRNLVSHEYFRVDAVIVWNTALRSIPSLRAAIQQIFDSLSAIQ